MLKVEGRHEAQGFADSLPFPLEGGTDFRQLHNVDVVAEKGLNYSNGKKKRQNTQPSKKDDSIQLDKSLNKSGHIHPSLSQSPVIQPMSHRRITGHHMPIRLHPII